MSESTLLLDLNQPNVTARLWNRAYAPTQPPPSSFDESIGYPGVWDVRCTSTAERTIGFQKVPAGPVRVWLRAPGYQDDQFDTVMPNDGSKAIRLRRVQPSAVHVDGWHLTDGDGHRWFGIGASSFLFYYRFLTEGPDALRPVLEELAELGFNLIRLFGMVDSFAHWYPQEHPDYYDRIPACVEFAAGYGFRTLWVANADSQTVMPDANRRREHWRQTNDQLAHVPDWVISSRVNEGNQHANDPGPLPKPAGILSSNGTFGGQPWANPPMPSPDWDVGEFEQRRDWPKMIVDTPVIQLQTGDTVDHVAHPVPIGLSEPVGFGEPGMHNRDTDPEHAYQLGGTAPGTAAWIVYHYEDGVFSRMMGPTQRTCAQAFIRGIGSR